jgi:hypothetical protein
MIEGFFLNGVYAITTGAPIGGQDDLMILAFAHKAKTPLPLLEPAKARTDIALDAPIFGLMPILGGVVFRHIIPHYHFTAIQ